MRLEQFLTESALRFGSRTAVAAGSRRHSYADIARYSERVAAALLKRGVGHGEPIALYLDDGVEAIVAAFGVLKAGAVIVPIDPALDNEAVARIFRETGAVGIVTEARLASAAAAAMAPTRTIKLVLLCGGDRTAARGASCLCYEDVIEGIGPGPRVARAGLAGDPALLLAEMRGAARGGALSHADVAAVAAYGDPSRIAASVLSYGGLCQLFATVKTGATLVLEGPRRARRRVERVAGEAEMALAG